MIEEGIDKAQSHESPQQILEETENTTPPIILQEQKKELKHSNQLSGAPPFLERLTLKRPIVPPEFDIEAKLRNLCVKIQSYWPPNAGTKIGH